MTRFWYVPATARASSPVAVRTSEAVTGSGVRGTGPSRPLRLSCLLLSHEPERGHPSGRHRKTRCKGGGHGGTRAAHSASPRRSRARGRRGQEAREREARGASPSGRRSPAVHPLARLVDLDGDAAPALGAVAGGRTLLPSSPCPTGRVPGWGGGRERGPQDRVWARAPAGSAWSGFSVPLAAHPPGAGSSSLVCCRRAGDSYRGRTQLAGHLLVFCVLGIYFQMVSV